MAEKVPTSEEALDAASTARRTNDPRALAAAMGLLTACEDDDFWTNPDSEPLLQEWTFWYWDRAGYSDDWPVRVWSKWWPRNVEADPAHATHGMALVAWHQAVRGARDDVHAMLDAWRKHVRPESEAEVDPILFDAAFMAGVWAEDADLARKGRDAYLEHLRREGTPPEGEHQFLRDAVRAASLFGWKDDLERWWKPYLAGLRDMYIGPEKEEMERTRAKALTALHAGNHKEARARFLELTEHAHDKKLGPEWVAEGSVEAARMSALLGSRHDAISDLKWAHEVMDRYGVIVFERPIRMLYERLP